MRILTLILILLIGVLRCTSNHKASPPGIDSYKVIKDDGLSSATDQLLAGSGKIIFLTPLYGIDSKHHFSLKFQLPSNGNFVELHSHISSTKMNDGVSIRFEKNNEQLKTVISSLGVHPVDISPYLDGMSQWNPIDLHLEIHDGMDKGLRILIWRGSNQQYTPENALYDSIREGTFFSSNGQGANWGLNIDGASLLKSHVELGYVE